MKDSGGVCLCPQYSDDNEYRISNCIWAAINNKTWFKKSTLSHKIILKVTGKILE